MLSLYSAVPGFSYFSLSVTPILGIHVMFNVLSTTNYAINFLFYGTMNASYRRRYIELLSCTRNENNERRPGQSSGHIQNRAIHRHDSTNEKYDLRVLEILGSTEKQTYVNAKECRHFGTNNVYNVMLSTVYSTRYAYIAVNHLCF